MRLTLPNYIEKRLLVVVMLLTQMIIPVVAQDDLMDMLGGDEEEETVKTVATFKATRLVNGHTIETRRKKTLDFLISHRFGRINGGPYELFGIDESNIRFALEYAVTDKFMIGVGRSSFEKTFDSFGKYKLLEQSSGPNSMPFSATYLSSVALVSLNTPSYSTKDTSRTNYFSSRMSFTNQVIIARKFSDVISWQIMPTMVHHNLVYGLNDPNDVFALGTGGRVKLSPSFSINGEYFFQLNPIQSTQRYNSFAIAGELETGGHVFQFSISNSRSMIEKGFITETTGDIFNGDLHLGFNIFRTF